MEMADERADDRILDLTSFKQRPFILKTEPVVGAERLVRNAKSASAHVAELGGRSTPSVLASCLSCTDLIEIGFDLVLCDVKGHIGPFFDVDLCCAIVLGQPIQKNSTSIQGMER
jgi:hypothetical protein